MRPGGKPRCRQFETADWPTPKSRASCPLPPRASMMSEAFMPPIFTHGEAEVNPKDAPARFTHGFVQFHGVRGSLPPMRGTEQIETLCDNFMLLWEATGLSKQEFARTVGLTPSQLTNISNYRNPPAPQAIAAAARVYGVTADFLYFGSLGGMRDEARAARLRELATRAPTQ